MKRSWATGAALLVAFGVSGCGHYLPADGWVTLFDGTSLDQWDRVGSANWRLANGAVEADSGNKATGFLVSKQSYGNFELRVEFWTSNDANSGIYMRCADRNKITDRSCYEANIFDQRPDPSYGTGAIVHRAVVNPMPKAGGSGTSTRFTHWVPTSSLSSTDRSRCTCATAS